MALIQYDVNMALKFVVTKSFKEFKEYSNIPANIRLDEDVLKTSFVFVFKTSSRRLDQDEYVRLSLTSSRLLQDVFKTYYRVKVFLVTQFQDIFETYSERF